MKRYIKLEEPVERLSLLERLGQMDPDCRSSVMGYITAWIGILSIAAVLIVLIIH